MISTAKNLMFKAIAGLGVISAVLVIGSSIASAQVVPTTCPSATVFYANGYSMNNCVPSYYPGYPQTTVYSNGYYGGTTGYTNGYTTVQTNPFTPPVASNNGFFQSAPTYTAPTYYYPPVQTSYNTTTYYGGYGYGNGYGKGYGNGYGNGYYYGNNGYYGGGYGNGYYGGGYYGYRH